MCFSRSSARARSAAPIIARRRRSVDANLATVWFSHPIRAGTLLGTPQRNVHGALLNPRAQLRCRTCPIRKALARDRKSTRLNSSHLGISYAVFCLKKKQNKRHMTREQDTRPRQCNAIQRVEAL